MAEICYNTDCPYNEWYQCKRSCTCITQLPDGFWYHGNGKLGGEFHPTKPNDEERYGEYVKVKHGRWIKCGDVYSDGDYECSECHKREWSDTDYCPNCGARMDEEIGEDKSHPFAESVMMGMDEVENGSCD